MTQLNKTILHVEGMTCSNCAATVTKALQKKGLEEVSVSFIDKEVSFLAHENTDLNSISKSISDLGYQVVDPPKSSDSKKGLTLLEKKFIASALFTIPLFFSMWLPFNWLHNPVTQLLLCIPVFGIGVWHFGKSAWGSVRMGIPNMDVLILIGSVSAFIYSLLGMTLYAAHQSHQYLFFETTATIITLVLLGNLIEERSVNQTGSAMKELAAMKPEKANLVSLHNDHEHLQVVDANSLLKYDVILVNAGDKIAVDGIVVAGDALVDESFLTGESLPIDKKNGDLAIGGSIVISGQLKVRATRVGKDTVLAQIIDLVKKAQTEKPAIQRLGDKISAIFVPLVLCIATITFFTAHFIFSISLQQSLMQSIAVLVISCPCAMGLATPTAVMAGIGRAAKNRILIKGGNTLEQFAQVKTIVFDKTGTLTTGHFRIKELLIETGVEKDTVLAILYSMELNSSHPIAKSIVAELKPVAQKMNFVTIREEKGSGMFATDEKGNNYYFGHSRNRKNVAGKYQDLILTKNETLLAQLSLEDDIKESAKSCLNNLHKMGIQTILLSGDSKAKCDALVTKLSITESYSEQSPIEKLNLIEKLAKKGKLAMVGDGMNDAPALSKADVAISLSNASSIAIESSQIILLNGENLNDIVLAIQLSKHTLMTIKQNLFWAFFYNVIAIPVAAIGMLNPMLAALSMAFSDVIVIGNSIRLKTKKLN